MTNWIFHILIAVLLTLGISMFFHLNLPIIFFAALIIGAILPDLDSPTSKATQIMNGIAVVAISYILGEYFKWQFSLESTIITVVVYATFIIFVMLIRPEHRGILHSYFFAVVAGIGAFVLTGNYYVGLGIIAGCFAHLIGDGILVKFF